MERGHTLISLFVLAAMLPYWHRCISVTRVNLNLNTFSNMTVYMKFRSTSTSSPQLFFTHYHVTRALYSNFLLYLNVTVPFFCHCENQKYYLKFVLTQGGWPKSSIRLSNHYHVFTPFNHSHRMNLATLFTWSFWFKISPNYQPKLQKVSYFVFTTPLHLFTSFNMVSLCRYNMSMTFLRRWKKW